MVTKNLHKTAIYPYTPNPAGPRACKEGQCYMVVSNTKKLPTNRLSPTGTGILRWSENLPRKPPCGRARFSILEIKWSSKQANERCQNVSHTHTYAPALGKGRKQTSCHDFCCFPIIVVDFSPEGEVTILALLGFHNAPRGQKGHIFTADTAICCCSLRSVWAASLRNVVGKRRHFLGCWVFLFEIRFRAFSQLVWGLRRVGVKFSTKQKNGKASEQWAEAGMILNYSLRPPTKTPFELFVWHSLGERRNIN